MSIVRVRTGRGRREQSQHVISKAICEALENRVYLSLAPTIAGSPSGLLGSNYTLNLSANPSGGSVVDHWTINWGDGTLTAPDLQTIEGNPTSVTHQYTGNPGIFNISATASTTTDSYGAQMLDPTFGTGGSTTSSFVGSFTSGLVEPDGQILVWGLSGSSLEMLRYNSDGSLDTSFGSSDFKHIYRQPSRGVSVGLRATAE